MGIQIAMNVQQRKMSWLENKLRHASPRLPLRTALGGRWSASSLMVLLVLSTWVADIGCSTKTGEEEALRKVLAANEFDAMQRVHPQGLLPIKARQTLQRFKPGQWKSARCRFVGGEGGGQHG